MEKAQVTIIMRDTFKRLDKLREAGQAEYAHKDDNAFANFDRVAADLGLDRKEVLWTYLRKHLDGIVSYIKGHKSQRESVHGRIDDAHVYLELLRGMIIEEGETLQPAEPIGIPVISLNNFRAFEQNLLNRIELFDRIFTVPVQYADHTNKINEKM